MPKRLVIIDYIKAFAIIFVIITHCSFSALQREHILMTFLIYTAVPLFMIITGYNYANSYLSKNVTSFFQMYCSKSFLKKFLRISIPFIIILLSEYFIYHATLMKNHSLLTHFFRGGIGPGSYYFPVMLQMIIIFPLIFYLIFKYKKKALLGLIFLEILSMFLFQKTNFDLKTYRILAVRYITLLSSGTYLLLNYKNINAKNMYIFLVIGLILLSILRYGNNPLCCYPYTKEYWGIKAGLPMLLYIFPVFYFIFSKFKDKKIDNFLGKSLQIIGKASWHIMLVQMFYYTFKPFNYFHNLYIEIILNLISCLSIGILFYIMDSKFISGKILKNL